ncbi:NAD-dependent epimerase/dehydratase family protein [Bacillus sp. FJAT-26390]|uniref:NAD-dependent epimerase/dehydratase family protein n=1 Tax=Bacillus sp. FJAT-26390 TaxID=1743142 RepID=UPI000807C93A|nr:NAD-dependent epimerase/dehydratase family protein [Bacillus sp. FJAT-26390]OBZ09219.1 NAD-dependent dehydratase [Bacillus sp. FJAT-26390]
MKILVTGGAGFIGSHLVERLLAEGHTVWTLDDFSNGRPEFLSHLQPNKRHTLIEGSVMDRGTLKKLIGKVDVVFHLAAVLGVKNTVDDPIKVIEGNIDGTRNVLELAYPRHVKVIFTSTSEIYGKNEELPFHELSGSIYGAPSVHRWCYATAKSLDEHMCFAYAKKGLPVTVLRYFNAYGPRQTNSQYGGVVAQFIKAALKGEQLEVYGDRMQKRCFTYVDDTVAGSLAALKPEANGLAFNIGTDRSITIRELAQLIVKLSSSKSPIVSKSYFEAYGPGYEDIPAREPDLTRSETLLGYRPKVMLEAGLNKTIDWYRNRI